MESLKSNKPSTLTINNYKLLTMSMKALKEKKVKILSYVTPTSCPTLYFNIKLTFSIDI